MLRRSRRQRPSEEYRRRPRGKGLNSGRKRGLEKRQRGRRERSPSEPSGWQRRKGPGRRLRGRSDWRPRKGPGGWRRSGGPERRLRGRSERRPRRGSGTRFDRGPVRRRHRETEMLRSSWPKSRPSGGPDSMRSGGRGLMLRSWPRRRKSGWPGWSRHRKLRVTLSGRQRTGRLILARPRRLQWALRRDEAPNSPSLTALTWCSRTAILFHSGLCLESGSQNCGPGWPFA
mmetsp:Transcript_51799/g.120389  ORF Transcript_51799/g.120389 Transcript_51799/m.120389 type:complete len:230 (+) Transcript_51799:722-1411(+)